MQIKTLFQKPVKVRKHFAKAEPVSEEDTEAPSMQFVYECGICGKTCSSAAVSKGCKINRGQVNYFCVIRQ